MLVYRVRYTFLYLFRRTDLLDPAGVHHDDPVRQGDGLGEIVGHQDGGFLLLADDLADRALFLHLEIQSGDALRLADAKVHAPQHLHRKEDERIADDAARVKTRAERRADDGDRPQARRGRQAAHLLIARH